MKTIPLTKGKVAIVDDENYERISSHKWYCNTLIRAVRTIGDGKNQKMIYMHREIMNAPDGYEVDHVNMNALDNRKENLRICSKMQNSFNKKKYSTNTTGFKGVTYRKESGLFRAQITVNYKNTVLGEFYKPEDAAKAYDDAAKRLMGNFARTNEAQ